MSRLSSNNSDQKSFSGKSFLQLSSVGDSFNTFGSSLVIGGNASKVSNNNQNMFIGNNAGNSLAFLNNTFIGHSCGQSSLNSAQGNVCIGSFCAQNIFSKENVCIGNESGKFIRSGRFNVFVGHRTGIKCSGSNNVIIGHKADVEVSSSSSNNIIIGSNSSSVEGNNNILIGTTLYKAQESTSDTLNIGNLIQGNIATQTVNLNLSTESTSADNLLGISNSGEVTKVSSKTFVIKHPMNSNKYLVHACLEGPENGVFYRGTGKTLQQDDTYYNCIVKMPPYFKQLVYKNSITVHLTPKNSLQVCGVKWVEDDSFCVYSRESTEFYWVLNGTRMDITSLDVEPTVESCVIKGFGPYTYTE